MAKYQENKIIMNIYVNNNRVSIYLSKYWPRNRQIHTHD